MKNKIIPITSKGKDFVNTVKMIPDRLVDVKKSSKEQAMNPELFNVNRVAAALHPKEQKLVIRKIVEHSADVKSYYLTWTGGQALAYFRAGQYLSFPIKIGDSVVTRAYSLASSPAKALVGEYHIMIKRVPDGFASGYILDNWKVGDKITAYAPEGCFTYEPLRDAPTVIGVAGGSGITPFLSMARAIDDGSEDFNLTLLYGAKTKDELVFKDELDAIAERNEKVKVVYVLSEGKSRGFERGFIGADLIKKYAPEDGKYSIFACGPEGMYKFLGQEIPKLGLERKFVRMEMFGVSKSAVLSDAIKEGEFKMTVVYRGDKTEYVCNGKETILTALERAAVKVAVRCRSGECGFCRSKLVSGTVYIPESIDRRRMADAQFGYIHPCCTYPTSDIEIKID
ncbi:MAG: FAD-binding oxidoreductase [Clostridia bacterium]|nr:FAD-binding oxidoreductase [Clostridia bacterium]